MDLKPLEVKEDDRGELVEAYKLPSDGQVFFVRVNPNQLRGNHYHLRKIEHFLVIDGSAEINVKDRETGNVVKVEVGSNPMLVTIHPNHTHNLIAGEFGCIFMVWCNEQFNPKDPDTYSEEI